MKGNTSYDDIARLFKELHQGRQFEIFTALDGEKNSYPRCFPANYFDGELKPTWQELEANNNEHRGIITAGLIPYHFHRSENLPFHSNCFSTNSV